jgi:hypothetical protein
MTVVPDLVALNHHFPDGATALSCTAREVVGL